LSSEIFEQDLFFVGLEHGSGSIIMLSLLWKKHIVIEKGRKPKGAKNFASSRHIHLVLFYELWKTGRSQMKLIDCLGKAVA